MALLETLLLLAGGFVLIILLGYIMVIGRIGWQFFKYNFPATKKRGTFYLLLLRSGRFKWIYTKFKTVWDWPDGTKTYIGKNFDRLAQTAEPLIFLVEGYPTNAMLADRLPKEEMSRFVNNIMKEIETASRLESEIEKIKPGLGGFIIPVLTLGFAALGALSTLYLVVNINEMATILEWIQNTLSELSPYVPEIVEALKNAPREL